MAIVKDLESHVVQDVLIAQKVHPVSFLLFRSRVEILCLSELLEVADQELELL